MYTYIFIYIYIYIYIYILTLQIFYLIFLMNFARANITPAVKLISGNCWQIVFLRMHTEYFSLFRPNAGKYGPEKTPYLNTFHAVCKNCEIPPCNLNAFGIWCG